MIITAHGGALKTGRNSKKYFKTIKNYNVDAIEVDIYNGKYGLYISHLPRPGILKKTALPLSFVFDFVAEHKFKVNCDVKQKNLIKPVLDLARQKGVTQYVYFTGNTVTDKDIKDLVEGEIALNKAFFKLVPTPENLAKIKKIIDDIENPRIRAFNVNKKYCTDAMLDEAKRIKLPLSIFTVDDADLLKKLALRDELFNITTNIPDVLTGKKNP
ncbi:MAG: hypothetical protein LBN25_02235 [Christensenellaceae bacterium]|jgi:hypothetical protein|nr:hypothetical protein [Christensenellaceae bacterium]